MNSTERCACDESNALRAEIEKRDTQPAPVGFDSDHFKVRAVDGEFLVLEIPKGRSALPNCGDEVLLEWMAQEAAE